MIAAGILIALALSIALGWSINMTRGRLVKVLLLAWLADIALLVAVFAVVASKP